WVLAISQATQTPPDLAAMLALAVAGAGTARRIRIVVRDDWWEPTNLYTVTALESGDRKSAVFREVVAPVRSLEKGLLKQKAPAIAARATERRFIEERLKVLFKKAAKANDPAERQEAENEAKQWIEKLATIPVIREPQLYCQSETPENLEKLLSWQ